jgi:hypothetical protein
MSAEQCLCSGTLAHIIVFFNERKRFLIFFQRGMIKKQGKEFFSFPCPDR